MGWTNRINRAIELLYLAVIFILPLFFLPNIYTTFEIPKVTLLRSVTLILLVLSLLKLAISKHFALPKAASPHAHPQVHKWLQISLISFCCFYILATIFSISPLTSTWGFYPRFQGLYTFFIYFIFAAIIFMYGVSDNTETVTKRLNRIICAIFISSALASLIAILQKFLPGFLPFWNDAAFEGRIYGTMGNPNYLGGFLIMVIPLMLMRLIEKRNTGYKFAGILVGLVFNFAALYFTYSRASYLGLVTALVLFSWVLAKKKRSPGIFLATAATILVLVGIVGSINTFGQNLKSTFWERLKFNGAYSESIETRLEIWPAAAKQILNRPWFGYGPETFALSFAKFAPANINTDLSKAAYPDRAHNEILDIAVQIGIPGLVCYLAFLVLLFYAVTRKILNDKSELAWTYLGILCGILALFVSNQFGFSVTVLWVYLFLFVALLMRYLYQDNSRILNLNISKTLKVIIVFITLLFAAGIIFFKDIRLIEADYYYRKGLENPTGQLSSQYNFKKATTLQPNFEQYRIELLK